MSNTNKPGIEVSLSSLVMAADEGVRAWREANIKTERIFYWLSDNPVVNGVDPLTQDPYNLDTDGAYLYRFVFGGFHDLDIEDILAAARKFTALG
jgi:hypothetical protein